VPQPARIWIVGSCVSSRLVEVILLTAFAVDVAAAFGGFLPSGLTSESAAQPKSSFTLSNFPFFGVNSLILGLSPGRSPLQAIS